MKIYNDELQAKNADRIKAWQLNYYAANKGAILDVQHRRWEQIKEEENARRRMQYHTDPEYRAYKLHHCRRSYEKNPEMRASYGKYWIGTPRGRAYRSKVDAERRGAKGEGGGEYRRFVLSQRVIVCSYCNARLTPEDVEFDHITSIADGGRDEADNLAPACRRCNASKYKYSLIDFMVRHVCACACSHP